MLNERLFKSIRENRIDEALECLRGGVSLAFSDWAGYSALHLVASQGGDDSRAEICRLLLRYGANVNAMSKLKKTPLHLACQNGCVQVSKILVEYGADISATDIMGMSPLHWALENNKNENTLFSLVNILLNEKSSIFVSGLFNFLDKFDRSPFDIARANRNWTILDHLTRIYESTQQSLWSAGVARDQHGKYFSSDLETVVDTVSDLAGEPMSSEPPEELFSDQNSRNHKEFFSVPVLKKADSPVSDDRNPEKSSGFRSCVKESEQKVFKSSQKIRKTYEAFLGDLDCSDDSESDFQHGLGNTKKKKISSSPIQNIEDTLLWLQTQALANMSDDFILEDKEFYLTEAGVLTLEYLNKIDPIGDEQRLLLKLAKTLEPTEATTSKMADERDDTQANSESAMDEDWLFNYDLNFDTI